MTEEFRLSRRQALAALGTVGAASAGTGIGTSAFFADTEAFENNGLTAGELDLGISYTARYANWSPDEDGGTTPSTADDVSVRMYDGQAGTTGDVTDLRSGETGLPTADDWLLAVDDPQQFLANTRTNTFPDGDTDTGGLSCGNLPQAGRASRPAISLSDVKPGDFGTVTFDFALCDNPGYVWLNGSLRSATEAGRPEPEVDDPDEVDDIIELLDITQAAVWVGNGDGYADDEMIPLRGSLRRVLDELGTGRGLALGGDVDQGLGRNCFSHEGEDSTVKTHHITLAWWVPVDHGNEIQSDAVTFDLGLYTEQCRHNVGTGLDMAELIRSPAMQQLLADLGHPSPSTPTADAFGSMGPVTLRFDQARTRRLELDDPLAVGNGDQTSTLYTTEIPSPVGSLQFVSTATELLRRPSFAFKPGVPTSIKTQLELDGDLGWPDDVRAALLGGETRSLFARGLSDADRERAAATIGRPVDFGVAYTAGGPGVYIMPPPRPQADGVRDTDRPGRSLLTDGGQADCSLPEPICEAAATVDILPALKGEDSTKWIFRLRVSSGFKYTFA